MKTKMIAVGLLLLCLAGHARSEEAEDLAELSSLGEQYGALLGVLNEERDDAEGPAPSNYVSRSQSHPMNTTGVILSRTEAASMWIQWETDRWGEALELVIRGSDWDWAAAYDPHRQRLAEVARLNQQARGHSAMAGYYYDQHLDLTYTYAQRINLLRLAIDHLALCNAEMDQARIEAQFAEQIRHSILLSYGQAGPWPRIPWLNTLGEGDVLAGPAGGEVMSPRRPLFSERRQGRNRGRRRMEQER